MVSSHRSCRRPEKLRTRANERAIRNADTMLSSSPIYKTFPTTHFRMSVRGCPSPVSSLRIADGSLGSEWQANTPAERAPAFVGDGHAQWLTAGAAVRLPAKAHALHDETTAMDWSSGIVRPLGATRSDDESGRGEVER